jgi:hypothetical protein
MIKAALLSVVCALALTTYCRAESYVITRLPGFDARGVDRLGRVILQRQVAGGGSEQVIWDDGTVVRLPNIASWSGSASGPLLGNANIHGSPYPSDQVYYLATHTTGGLPIPASELSAVAVPYAVNPSLLEPYQRSQTGFDINSNSQIIGYAVESTTPCSGCGTNYETRPAYWNQTSQHILEGYGSPSGLNTNGDIVGYFFDDRVTPAVWTPSGASVTVAKWSSSLDTAFQDINDVGTIVGQAARSNGRFPYFVRSAGQYHDLGLEGLTFYVGSLQTRINNRGQVVVSGRPASTNGAEQPYLITPRDTNDDQLPDTWTGQSRALKDIVPIPAGVTFQLGYGPPPVPDISDSGHISGQMVVNGAYAGFRMTPLTKYKQFRQSPAAIGWGDEELDPALNGSPGAWTFRGSGCVIANLATISSYYGAKVDPISMRDYVLDTDPSEMQFVRKPDGIEVIPANFEYRENGLIVAGDRTPHRGLETIVSELRNGRPVMLAVPSTSLSRTRLPENNEFHYVTAYGLDPRLSPSDSWAPADVAAKIYISDPGNGARLYGEYGWTVDGMYEEKMNITLAQYFAYFDKTNVAGGSYNVASWFGIGDAVGGEFLRNGVAKALSADKRGKLITTFVAAASKDELDLKSHMVVESPVEIRITDLQSGLYYASSESIALPGDFLLYRSGFDTVAPQDEGGDTGETEVQPFPPYMLYLPEALLGKSLDVEIIGIGNGPYKISLLPRSKFISSDPLEGLIALNERQFGRFSVVAIPEPATCALLAFGAPLLFQAKRWRRGAVCVHRH